MATSENKLILLAIGYNRDGPLYFDDAKNIYSSTEAAVSALQSLRGRGFIVCTGTPGLFRVVKITPAVKSIAKNLKKEKGRLSGVIRESKDDVGGDPEEVEYARETKSPSS